MNTPVRMPPTTIPGASNAGQTSMQRATALGNSKRPLVWRNSGNAASNAYNLITIINPMPISTPGTMPPRNSPPIDTFVIEP